MSNSNHRVTIQELDEAQERLSENGIAVEIHSVEITMAETRQSPTHGQYSSNKGGVMLGATISVDATQGNSREVLEDIISALLAETGHNLQRVMGSMS